jgi:hypothetical protein
MQKVILYILFLYSAGLYGQSKSITRFRSDFKENSNMFFYRSTLKMLNTENNPELADLLDDIEEIRVLNYEKAQQSFTRDNISALKNKLKEEDYNNILMINENGNNIELYNKEKRGKTVGFVAFVENKEKLILIDLVGNIDVKKFMQLKQKLDVRIDKST